MVPVLNELGRRVPGLHAILRTTVPRSFFEGRLTIPWEVSAARQDVGCVQHGPLHVDVAATWIEHIRLHEDWDRLVTTETRAIQASAPNLVLSDISYLAIEAGGRAGLPTVGLCNLSWDRVLDRFLTPDRQEHRSVLSHIRRAYALTDLMVRLAPGIELDAFRRVADVGPVATPSPPDRAALLAATGASPGERLVLVALGGIPLQHLPCKALDELSGYRFVVAGPVPSDARRSHALSAVPLAFGTVFASVDVVVSKPGYNTVVEAVALAKPMVYVPRSNFVDEPALVKYLHRFGRGVELSLEDFHAGRWKAALEQVGTVSPPGQTAPVPTGASEAASILAGYLNGREARG
ncbi:MAG: hypothetical protein AB1411_14330 [Nitrospirota bacterium]